MRGREKSPPPPDGGEGGKGQLAGLTLGGAVGRIRLRTGRAWTRAIWKRVPVRLLVPTLRPPPSNSLTSQGDAWKALANGSGRQEGLGAGHGRREASPLAVTPGLGTARLLRPRRRSLPAPCPVALGHCYLGSRVLSAVAAVHHDTVGQSPTWTCGAGHGVPWVTDAPSPLPAGTGAAAFLHRTP